MKRLLAIGLAFCAVAGCAAPPPSPDATLLALAAAGTLEVVGLQAAAAETQTATQLWPTPTAVPPTATPSPTPTASATNTQTPTATATPPPSGTVQAEGVVRSGPDMIYAVAAQVTAGEMAFPLGQTEAGDWYLIVLSGGEEVWILAENFALSPETGDLPIVTDLPPTPTVPPTLTHTASPVPTHTATPSPYTCDLSVSRVGNEQKLLVVGFHWPPDEPLYLTASEIDPGSGWGVWGIANTQINRTGNANSEPPFGFIINLPYKGGRATYTLTAGVCLAQFNYP